MHPNFKLLFVCQTKHPLAACSTPENHHQRWKFRHSTLMPPHLLPPLISLFIVPKKKIISNDFQTEIVVRGSCLNRLYKFEFWAFVLNEKLNCFNGNWYLNELVVPIQLQLQFTMIYCFRSKKAGRIISSWTCYECDAVVLTAANLTVTDNQLGGDMHSGWVHLSNFTCMTTSFWKSAYIMERVTCHIWIVILSIYLVCFVFVFLQWFSEQIVHEPIKPLG